MNHSPRPLSEQHEQCEYLHKREAFLNKIEKQCISFESSLQFLQEVFFYSFPDGWELLHHISLCQNLNISAKELLTYLFFKTPDLSKRHPQLQELFSTSFSQEKIQYFKKIVEKQELTSTIQERVKNTPHTVDTEGNEPILHHAFIRTYYKAQAIKKIERLRPKEQTNAPESIKRTLEHYDLSLSERLLYQYLLRCDPEYQKTHPYWSLLFPFYKQLAFKEALKNLKNNIKQKDPFQTLELSRTDGKYSLNVKSIDAETSNEQFLAQFRSMGEISNGEHEPLQRNNTQIQMYGGLYSPPSDFLSFPFLRTVSQHGTSKTHLYTEHYTGNNVSMEYMQFPVFTNTVARPCEYLLIKNYDNPHILTDCGTLTLKMHQDGLIKHICKIQHTYFIVYKVIESDTTSHVYVTIVDSSTNKQKMIPISWSKDNTTIDNYIDNYVDTLPWNNGILIVYSNQLVYVKMDGSIDVFSLDLIQLPNSTNRRKSFQFSYEVNNHTFSSNTLQSSPVFRNRKIPGITKRLNYTVQEHLPNQYYPIPHMGYAGYKSTLARKDDQIYLIHTYYPDGQEHFVFALPPTYLYLDVLAHFESDDHSVLSLSSTDHYEKNKKNRTFFWTPTHEYMVDGCVVAEDIINGEYCYLLETPVPSSRQYSSYYLVDSAGIFLRTWNEDSDGRLMGTVAQQDGSLYYFFRDENDHIHVHTATHSDIHIFSPGSVCFSQNSYKKMFSHVSYIDTSTGQIMMWSSVPKQTVDELQAECEDLNTLFLQPDPTHLAEELALFKAREPYFSSDTSFDKHAEHNRILNQWKQSPEVFMNDYALEPFQKNSDYGEIIKQMYADVPPPQNRSPSHIDSHITQHEKNRAWLSDDNRQFYLNKSDILDAPTVPLLSCSKKIDGFFAKEYFGKYSIKQHQWGKLNISLHAPRACTGKTYTVTLHVPTDTPITLPQEPGDHIQNISVRSSFPTQSTVLPSGLTQICISTPLSDTFERIVESEDIEITYTINPHVSIMPTIEATTSELYDAWVAEVGAMYGDTLSQPMFSLPYRYASFARALCTLAPHKRINKIQEFLRENSVYDNTDNEENFSSAHLYSLQQHVSHMESKMKELQKNEHRKNNMQHKLLAGNCQDFAYLGAALMREAGLMSGISTGISLSHQKNGYTKDLHATTFVLWKTNEGFFPHIVDCTPSSMSPETWIARLVEYFRAPLQRILGKHEQLAAPKNTPTYVVQEHGEISGDSDVEAMEDIRQLSEISVVKKSQKEDRNSEGIVSTDTMGSSEISNIAQSTEEMIVVPEALRRVEITYEDAYFLTQLLDTFSYSPLNVGLDIPIDELAQQVMNSLEIDKQVSTELVEDKQPVVQRLHRFEKNYLTTTELKQKFLYVLIALKKYADPKYAKILHLAEMYYGE